MTALAEGVGADVYSAQRVLVAEDTLTGALDYAAAFDASMADYEVVYYVDNLCLSARDVQDEALMRLAVRGQHAHLATMDTLHVALLGYHPVAQIDAHARVR